MTRLIVAALVLAGLIAPAGAQAGIGWELKAADQVERVANHRAPGYSFVASCRSIARTKFTCDYMGYRGSCNISGRATVTKLSRYTYRARLSSWNRDCF